MIRFTMAALLMLAFEVQAADEQQRCTFGAEILTETVQARELGLPVPQVADSAGTFAQFVKDFEKGLDRIDSGSLGAIRDVLSEIYPEEMLLRISGKQDLARDLYLGKQFEALMYHEDMTSEQLGKMVDQLRSDMSMEDVIRSLKPPIDEALQDAVNKAYGSDLTVEEIRRLWYQECMIK